MKRRAEFQPGIEVLLNTHPGWIRGLRVALVSHTAAITRTGETSLEALLRSGLPRRLSVWSPEHGYFGEAGAGEHVRSRQHPLWPVRVFSLYGTHRHPTPAMLRQVDVIVVDLQDIAVRCYTYVSTLRHVLEAAARRGIPVIVADRPVPFPVTVDGPMLDPACASFVGAIPAPMVYGLTPGECARWLRRHLHLEAPLRVAPLQGYHRDTQRSPDWPAWVPPSPGIATWESAWCYPATVLTEAFPALDCGRPTRLPFQSLASASGSALKLRDRLTAAALPGIAFHPHIATRSGEPGGSVQGVRLTITDPCRYRPVLTAVTMLDALGALLGRDALWNAPGNRPSFFDSLFGTPTVRLSLRAGQPPAEIAAAWDTREAAAFRRARARALLYTGATP